MKKVTYWMMSLLCMIAMVACHTEEHEHHHEHEHEHGSQYTVYNSDFEVFMEVMPLVLNEENSIALHLTSLSNFKPVDSAKITLSLVVGNKNISQTETCSETKGIYKFNFTPKVAGQGRLVAKIDFSGQTSTMDIANVQVYNSEKEADEHHHHEEEVANAVSFPKEKSWKIDFSTEEVRLENFGEVIKTVARVMPSQSDAREVVAKISGVVTFANNDLVEGSHVSAGQRLFSIESDGMADNNMEVKLKEAASNYKLAKSEYERKQKLAADKIVSESELNRSRTEYENAQSLYNSLKRNFSAKGQNLSSPINGFVTQINVKNGAYVEAGQPIVVVSKNKDMFVRAELQSRYFNSLSKIQSVSFKPNNSDQVYSLNDLHGGLVSYAKSMDANSPLIPITFKFNNTANLLSGDFVTLYIKTQSENVVATVPNEGIIEEMGSYFVFVQVNPELFEKREVVLGGTDGFRTIVKQGLKEGERVVGRGAIMVKLAQSAGALDPHAGHVH